MTSAQTNDRSVRVWDAPTRVFHWLLAGLIVLAWFTGEGEGLAAVTHRASGSAIAGLVLFRVIWGFVGGEHAKFSDFAFAPRAALVHAQRLLGGRAPRHLGHNPLGAIFVYLLLCNVAFVAVTGLMSAGESNAGPFAGAAGEDVAELHEIAFRVLQGLVVIHLAGVVVETVMTKDGLTQAMITGRKRRRVDEMAADAREGRAIAFFVAALLGAVLAIGLTAAPVSSIGAMSG